MNTVLFTHSACLYHDTPFGHPECADRLRAVLHALEDESFVFLERRMAPRASREALLRVHDEALVARIEALEPAELGDHAHIDADTAMSRGSLEAAYRAAGAVIAGVDAVFQGKARNAYCAIRPPGHHAEPHRAMGFCLFNNVAIGALHALAEHGAERVGVIDFDVHHGNGTQTVAMRDARVFFGSIHEDGNYPGTGHAHERGPANNILNAPVPAGTGSIPWRAAMAEILLPALDAFQPDLVMISAGFDAHAADPLAHLRLTEADFAWATAEIAKIAATRCDGRLVSTLEGGYDLAALARSSVAHVRALMEA